MGTYSIQVDHYLNGLFLGRVIHNRHHRLTISNSENKRLFFGTVTSRLYALDAVTGKLDLDFGTGGTSTLPSACVAG